jgi:hypothetical protein
MYSFCTVEQLIIEYMITMATTSETDTPFVNSGKAGCYKQGGCYFKCLLGGGGETIEEMAFLYQLEI